MFLHFDPNHRRFMFEKRIFGGNVLSGMVVIPGGKIEDAAELGFPLYALRSEQLEEYGIVPERVVYLGEDGEMGRVRLFCFLTIGLLHGELTNKEPDKHEIMWLAEDEVYPQDGGVNGINPVFELNTTQRILRKARAEMVRLGI